jgi:hypothetical protein
MPATTLSARGAIIPTHVMFSVSRRLTFVPGMFGQGMGSRGDRLRFSLGFAVRILQGGDQYRKAKGKSRSGVGLEARREAVTR